MRAITSLLLALVISAAFVTKASAWEGGDGGAGGCCLVPPELSGIAKILEASFEATDHDTLARQSWARELCDNHPCGNDVSEDQARDLLQNFGARVRQERAEERADRNLNVSIAGVFVSVIAILATGLGFFGTKQARRNARSALDKSIRTEAYIDGWVARQARPPEN
ncbi:MAG: hypothetical protein JJU21_10430 [Salinarimonas sp.]|nr:hypothetical protein [Salinarimonas sp.]